MWAEASCHGESGRLCCPHLKYGEVNASVVKGSPSTPTPTLTQRKEHFSEWGWLSCWKEMVDDVIFIPHKCGCLK